MIGVIKKQDEILGKLEKLNEKIVYKSDHRIVSTNLCFNKAIKTKSSVVQVKYEGEETE